MISCCCPPMLDLPFMYGDCEKRYRPEYKEGARTLEQVLENVNRYVDDLGDHFTDKFVPYHKRNLTVKVSDLKIEAPFNECTISDYPYCDDMYPMTGRRKIQIEIPFRLINRALPGKLINEEPIGDIWFNGKVDPMYRIHVDHEYAENWLLVATKYSHAGELAGEFWEEISNALNR